MVELQLLIMANRYRIYLFIYLMINCILSCNTMSTKNISQTDNKSSEEIKTEDTNFVNNDSFLPDTSLSQLFYLNKAIFLSHTDIMRHLNLNKDIPDIYISNKSNSEYCRMFFFPGSTKNYFSLFEVGSCKNLNQNIRLINEKECKRFITESNIKLGMSYEDIINIKGEQFKEIKKNDTLILYYELNDYPKNSFLKRYNMPTYYAEYTFYKNKLYKFIFGFEYP